MQFFFLKEANKISLCQMKESFNKVFLIHLLENIKLTLFECDQLSLKGKSECIYVVGWGEKVSVLYFSD